MNLSKGIGFPKDEWTVEDWEAFYLGLDWLKRRMLARRSSFQATESRPAVEPLPEHGASHDSRMRCKCGGLMLNGACERA